MTTFIEAGLRTGYVLHAESDADRSALSENIQRAFILEMANYGFTVSNPERAAILTESEAQDILHAARHITGADRDLTPIYPGFPKQVKELPTATLLIEQILHYLSFGTLLPDYEDLEFRPGLPLIDMVRSNKTVTIANLDEGNFLSDLVSRPTGLSTTEVKLLNEVVAHSTFPLEELESAYLAAKSHENTQHLVEAASKIYPAKELFSALAPITNNSDRLLRLFLSLYTSQNTHLVYEDPELYSTAIHTLRDDLRSTIVFDAVPRRVRALLVRRLGEISEGYKADYLVKHKTLWRAVIRTVHGFEHATTPEAKRALDIIHDNIEYTTFASTIEVALDEGRIVDAVTLMTDERPGELIRRAVSVLRKASSHKDVKALQTGIKESLKGTTLTTIISAYNGILSANSETPRLVKVAGRNNALVSREIVKIPQEYIDEILETIREEITHRLKDLPFNADTVGVDSQIPVPLVARDTSESDQVIDRGTRFKVEGSGNTLRLYCYWKNTSACASGYIDLGVSFVTDSFKHLGALTWNTWDRYREVGTYSGDKCVRKGDSAVEYYDVDLDKVKIFLPRGTRYLAVSLQSWSGIPYKDVDIVAGAMFRSEPDSGEPFDPRTVVTAFTPTTDSLMALSYVFDLENNELIWVDSSTGSQARGVSADSDHSIGGLVRSELSERLTFGDLAVLWAKAHGAATEDTSVDMKTLRTFVGV